MELFSYYNLSESANAGEVIKELERLGSELKIDYSLKTNEVFGIVDIDLTEYEVFRLHKLFEENDVLPDYDYEGDDFYDDLDMGDYGDEGYDF